MSDYTPDKRVIKTYVWHEEKCFFVSTITRPSSAGEGFPYNETMAWAYDWNTNERGEWIYQDGAPKGSIALHQAVVEALHKTGKPPIDQD